MSAEIKIFRKNFSTIVLQCSSPTIERELSHYFSAFASNYRFMPLFKQGVWDGRLRFFTKDNELASGLIEHVYKFARDGKYKVECMFERDNNQLLKRDFDKFVELLDLKLNGVSITLHDYQYTSIFESINKKNMNVHISTAGGKSMVIYVISRFLTLQDKRVLIVCPTTQLVEQMFGDFESYGWDATTHCHKIYSGQRKLFDSPVSISTWQSLQTIKDKSIFESFDCIIVDEAQGAKANVLQKISKDCINAEYRFGFSGTYPEAGTADWFAITGAFGPIQTFATYKTLQADGRIAPIKIFKVRLKYPKDFKIKVYQEGKREYSTENDLIYAYEARSKFLCKMVQNIDDNVLILFQKKEKHGYVLREIFERELVGKEVLYIDGDIDVLDRDEYRKIMETKNNIVLLATFATVAAGVNIKNLPNVFFASSYKSKVKVLQAIGRGLRLHKNKKCLKLYDIIDDVSFRTKEVIFINYSLKHSKERQKYYDEQSWPCKEVIFNLD